jgi:hypothetical protein
LIEDERSQIVSMPVLEVRYHRLHMNREIKTLPIPGRVAKSICVGVPDEPPTESHDCSRNFRPCDSVSGKNLFAAFVKRLASRRFPAASESDNLDDLRSTGACLARQSACQTSSRV